MQGAGELLGVTAPYRLPLVAVPLVAAGATLLPARRVARSRIASALAFD